MKEKPKRKRKPQSVTRKQLLLLAAIAVVLVIAAVCGGIYGLFEDWSTYVSNYDERALNHAESFLEELSTYHGEQTQIDLTPYWGLMENCLSFLQEAMTRNDNQYTLIVAGVFGDYGTPKRAGTGATEVVIEVVFPDGTRVALQYYASTLEHCFNVADDS